MPTDNNSSIYLLSIMLPMLLVFPYPCWGLRVNLSGWSWRVLFYRDTMRYMMIGDLFHSYLEDDKERKEKIALSGSGGLITKIWETKKQSLSQVRVKTWKNCEICAINENCATTFEPETGTLMIVMIKATWAHLWQCESAVFKLFKKKRPSSVSSFSAAFETNGSGQEQYLMSVSTVFTKHTNQNHPNKISKINKNKPYNHSGVSF